MYFLRNTTTPLKDVRRNFSGHQWVKNIEDVEYFQKKMNPLYPPKFDKENQIWCVDPEYGLSGFAFEDENTFQISKDRIINYGLNVAIFESNDFILDGGLDSEDVFRDAMFLGCIDNVELVNYDFVCDLITKME